MEAQYVGLLCERQHTYVMKAGVGMTAMQLPFDFRLVWAGAKLTFPFVRRGIAAEGKQIPTTLKELRLTRL